MTAGEAIKSIRMALLLNQAEFGAKLGVSSAAICSWELEKKKPRLHHIRTILEMAKKLKLKIDAKDFIN